MSVVSVIAFYTAKFGLGLTMSYYSYLGIFYTHSQSKVSIYKLMSWVLDGQT
jgi:hypothetical protein